MVKSREAIVWFLLAIGTVVVMVLNAACGGDSNGSVDSPTRTASAPSGGELSIVPDAGPVGTDVEITGIRCAEPGQSAYLSFQGGLGASTGTLGAQDIQGIIPDSNGRFVAQFTIPVELGTYQGDGGGMVVPGTYRFVSYPQACSANFTVTEPAD